MSWLSIEGYEGRYAVSEDGQIMSMNFNRSGRPGIMATRRRRGYESVSLRRKSGKAKDFVVHSLVAAAFIGPRPHGLAINHKDGNKLNNRVGNLEYLTYSENSLHAYRIGIQAGRKGDDHHSAKLNTPNVIAIRSRLDNGERQKAIAAEFGVDPSLISRIKSGELWPHVLRKVG